MTQLLNDFLSGSAAWGVLLTLAAFALGTLINKVTGKAIFNPLLLGSIFVIIFLSVCNIPYADYKASAAPVNYLLLPATVHYYVVVVSVAVAILLGKHAFGGYGHYPFNPAAFGYAVAAVSWPGEVFLYPVPFTTMSVLDTGSATVMESVSHTLRAGGVPNVDTFDLILGNYAGPIGATSVLILVACAMYLWMRRDITLGIPFGFLLSCALVAFFYPRVNTLGLELPWQYLDIRLLSLKYEMLSGALIFAAVFLVNEPVTRPKNTRAHFVYGMILGFMTMMFRYFGSYDTGVCFAVLAVNALAGYLDRLFSQKIFRREVRS